MTVIGLDPGPEESAWVAFDKGKAIISRTERNIDLRNRIKNFFFAQNFTDAFLVIEKVECYGMAVGKEVFETVFWSGIFAEAWGSNYARIGRGRIKMHLCGNMRAKDANIRQSLIDKLGAPGTKNSPGPTYGISKHLWAALAVAVTWAETHNQPI